MSRIHRMKRFFRSLTSYTHFFVKNGCEFYLSLSHYKVLTFFFCEAFRNSQYLSPIDLALKKYIIVIY